MQDKTIFMLRLIKTSLLISIFSVLTIYLYHTIYLEIILARNDFLTYLFFIIPVKKEEFILIILGISIWSFLLIYSEKNRLEFIQKKPIQINFSAYTGIPRLLIVSSLLFVFSVLIIDYATYLVTILTTKYSEEITTKMQLHMSLVKLLWLVLFSILWTYTWLYFKKLEKIFFSPSTTEENERKI